MGNAFGPDIVIQVPDPKQAASFYIEALGFEVTEDLPDLIGLRGPHINLFIERGPTLGPVLETFVEDVDAANAQVLARGGTIVKDEPEVPRCYVRDPFGVTTILRKPTDHNLLVGPGGNPHSTMFADEPSGKITMARTSRRNPRTKDFPRPSPSPFASVCRCRRLPRIDATGVRLCAQPSTGVGVKIGVTEACVRHG